jgi:DNA-binding Xre family transcriptional regulator
MGEESSPFQNGNFSPPANAFAVNHALKAILYNSLAQFRSLCTFSTAVCTNDSINCFYERKYWGFGRTDCAFKETMHTCLKTICPQQSIVCTFAMPSGTHTKLNDMLQINLTRIFKARGIEQPYKYLVQNGFVPFTAHKYKNGKVDHIRLDHIEKLCTLLNCTPNDILEWRPDDLLDDRANHPLQKIRTRDKKLEIGKLLNNFSLEKLEEIEKLLISHN